MPLTKYAPLPDCVIPDGAEPCAGYSALRAEINRLHAARAAAQAGAEEAYAKGLMTASHHLTANIELGRREGFEAGIEAAIQAARDARASLATYDKIIKSISDLRPAETAGRSGGPAEEQVVSDHPAYDPADPATSWALNPWRPMSRPIDLKHLGKLGEELSEAGQAVSRCIIQGIDESEPITRKPNREWLENELADVQANTELVVRHFGLDSIRMTARMEKKISHLRGWHSMLEGE